MIYLDDQNLIHQAAHTDGVYHVMVEQSEPKVKEVLLDGIKIQHVMFCDTNKGYLIKHKQAVDGNIIVENGNLIYEVRTGKVEVVLDGLEKQTD
ncbi:hypothetical protein ACBQ24_09500 [Acinetobacter terrestris]|uniref:hypothetical protein n=1 Tax=Acinetobacter terrestris TaxID=2529843 RepID=UPI003526A41F